MLIAARGETVARDELLRALWTDVAVEESSLPKCISQLRKALGDEHATLVETVPRLGYRLAAPAEEIIESAAAPPRRRWLMVAAAAIVLLAVAGAFALWLPHRNRIGEAERLYRESWLVSQKRDRESTATAIRLLQQAVQLNPKHAPAYAALSQTMHRNLPYLDEGAPAHIVAAARRSVELDAGCISCRISYGFFLFYYAWDWREAERHLRVALTGAPSTEDSHINMAMLLAATGRLSEASDAIDAAIRLNPYRAGSHAVQASILYFQKRYSDAIAAARRAISLDANYVAAADWHSRAATLAGRHSEGLGAILRIRFPEWSDKVNGAFTAKGKEAAWRELLNLTSAPDVRRAQCWRRDIWFLNAGEPEKALDEIELCLESHNVNLAWLAVDPALDPLRGHPRFLRVVRTMGLAAASPEGRAQESR